MSQFGEVWKKQKGDRCAGWKGKRDRDETGLSQFGDREGIEEAEGVDVRVKKRKEDRDGEGVGEGAGGGLVRGLVRGR